MVAALTVLSQTGNEVLRGLSILLGDESLVFDGGLAILLALLLVAALARHRAEDSRRGQDLVEVLELLAGPLFVAIGDGPVVDLLDIWETVDDKSAEKDGVRHLVPLN